MKQCSKCGIEKESSEFSKDKTHKDGLSSVCKNCRSVYAKQWREDHKESVSEYQKEYRKTHSLDITKYQKTYKQLNIEKFKEYNRKSRLERKEDLYDLKTPCVKCGEERPYVIDFHHINHNEKRFNISTRATHYSLNSVINEVKKCVCLCRNCHTEFHYLYGNKPKQPIESLAEYLDCDVVELLEKR